MTYQICNLVDKRKRNYSLLLISCQSTKFYYLNHAISKLEQNVTQYRYVQLLLSRHKCIILMFIAVLSRLFQDRRRRTSLQRFGLFATRSSRRENRIRHSFARTQFIPANSGALCVSLTPVDQTHRSHASRTISQASDSQIRTTCSLTHNQQKFNSIPRKIFQ